MPPLAANRHAVCVDGADAGLPQAADRFVRMLRRVADMRPVEERGNPGIERLERADEVGGVDVVGAVMRADVAEHLREVLIECAAWQDAANRRLPRVPVRVDEPRHDDAIGRIDDLGIPGLDRPADLLDRAVFNQHVAAGQVAGVFLQRQDIPAANQRPSLHLLAPVDVQLPDYQITKSPNFYPSISLAFCSHSAMKRKTFSLGGCGENVSSHLTGWLLMFLKA